MFCKPDDRWEANDVANRCQDVVEGLQKTLAQYQQAMMAGEAAQLPPLDDVLLRGLE